jgi:hypothetical protein
MGMSWEQAVPGPRGQGSWRSVASSLSTLRELAAGHGRPVPRATVVGPVLEADPGKAAAQLAGELLAAQ